MQKTGRPIAVIYTSYDVLLRKEFPFGGHDDCIQVKFLVALICKVLVSKFF